MAARTANGGGGAVVDKGVDFANYFCTYGYLYHQKEMLSDHVRMDAYHGAIFRNPHHFRGKVVLDVGTGSGILAVWCAQAGAKKVYAVEATKMAEHARVLANGNGLGHLIEVIEGSIEDITLPEKVDVIISEWMGYFLLRESMFDSVICARDRWLKPDGVMYPSHARMWLAPIKTRLGDQKVQDYEDAMSDWNVFIEDIDSRYGVNMDVLSKAYHEEHEKYYLKTSLWANLVPQQVIGQAAVLKEIDCLTATVDDIRTIKAQVNLPILESSERFTELAGWFDVHFRGRKQNPAIREIELSTAPSEDEGTHWGQQVFLLPFPLKVEAGGNLAVSLSMSRTKENHRLMDMEFDVEFQQADGNCFPPVSFKISME